MSEERSFTSIERAGTATPIPVSSYPPSRTYGRFESAIEGARRHPLQQMAKEDAARLSGASVKNAFWTETEHGIAFSNGLFLHIRVKADAAWMDDVTWRVTDSEPTLRGTDMGRIGSPTVLLDWGGEIGIETLDRSALAEKRLGAVVTDLFVNEMGLHVYCRGCLIWWFSAVRRKDLGRPILHVSEDD